MFHRLAKHFFRLLPFSAIVSGYLCYNRPFKMSEGPLSDKYSHLNNKVNSKIKIIKDIEVFLRGQLTPNRSIIFFQFTSNPFINEQVILIAQNFIRTASNQISQDFEFVFLDSNNDVPSEDSNNYFIVYGQNGEKAIGIDAYLNKNKQKGHIKLDNKQLFKRIIDHLNKFRQVSLENVREQLTSIQLNDNYSAIFTASSENYKTQEAKVILQKYLKKYDIKSKNLNRFVIKDAQTKTIFGISQSSAQEVHLLVPDDKNLKKKGKETLKFFNINGKQFTKIDVNKANLNELLVFPPIQAEQEPDKYVLNVYINKNKSYSKIQDQIYEELSKDEYQKYIKNIYYTNEVQHASIILQMNDYTKQILQAFEPKTHFLSSVIKELLTNTYEYRYNITPETKIESQELQRWILQSQDNKTPQYYKSQEPENPIWAEQITGEQYKEIRDSKFDKVIYHYSHHCHGCKKFGGKFEDFAKNKNNFPNLNFYRINNDANKSEGVRNYNSTPVFVYYKSGYKYPFIYKQPIFTEQLFEDFLKITSELKIITPKSFELNISTKNKSNLAIQELLKELKQP